MKESQEIEDVVDSLLGSSNLGEAKGDLLKLVGKSEDDDLTQADARTIGRKVARMSGDRQKSYLGMIKALGGYYKGRGKGTAKLTGLRKAAMAAYNAAKKD